MKTFSNELIQNIINYVERGDCGPEGLTLEARDPGNTLVFAEIVETNGNDPHVESHMFVAIGEKKTTFTYQSRHAVKFYWEETEHFEKFIY